MATGHRTAMLFPKLLPTLQNLLGEGFLSIFFSMEVNLDNHAKVQKSFSSFIDLLLNISAVNLFLGIFTRIKYLNSQKRFSAI